jgi:hypothetical protein
MMNRLQQILIGALVVQLALVGVVFWPRTPASATAGAPLFGTVKPTDITTVTVSDTSASTKMTRQGDGWVLPDAGNYPADAKKLNDLATKLAGLKNDRLVTQTAASHNQLQVADTNYSSKVDFQAAGAAHTLYIGSSAGGSSTHVRVGGQNEVYLTSGINNYDIKGDVTGWVNTQYISTTLTDVTGMTLKNASGELSFAKDAQGKWQLAGLAAGEQISDTAMSELLNAATSLQLTKPLGNKDDPAYGMAQPLGMLTVKTKKDNQEKTYKIQVGAKDAKDNTYVVKWSDSPYYVRASSYSVSAIVDKKRADYTQHAPTPTSAAGPASAATAVPTAAQ